MLANIGQSAMLAWFFSIVLVGCLCYKIGELNERVLFNESMNAGELKYTEDFRERMYGSKKRADSRDTQGENYKVKSR